MPWCPSCDRFLSPSTVRADGTCPSCGRPVDPGAAQRPADADVLPAGAPQQAVEAVEVGEEPLPPIPWHLKLLALALAVYLGWRLWQGIEWVGTTLL